LEKKGNRCVPLSQMGVVFWKEWRKDKKGTGTIYQWGKVGARLILLVGEAFQRAEMEVSILKAARKGRQQKISIHLETGE